MRKNYSDATNALKPGDIVDLDPAGPEKSIVKSAGDYDSSVFGVVSTDPGVLLSGISENHGTTDLVNPKPVALNGRVPTNVSTENGSIAIGDYIAASSIPGVGMKATHAGYVIGKALENYSGTGVGSIEVFTKTDFYPGPVISAKSDPNNSGQNNPETASVNDGLTASAGESQLVSNQAFALLQNLISQKSANPANPDQTATDVSANTVSAWNSVVTPTVATQSLIVTGDSLFKGGLEINSIQSLNDVLTFDSDTLFMGHLIATGDTAGFATIEKGLQKVNVTYDRQYLDTPVVNISLTINQDKSLSENADPSALAAWQATEQQTVNDLAQNDFKYFITDNSINGFGIYLTHPLPTDVTFSWTALAVQDGKLFSAKAEIPAAAPQLAPDPAISAIQTDNGSADAQQLTQPAVSAPVAPAAASLPPAAVTDTESTDQNSTASAAGTAASSPAVTAPATPVIPQAPTAASTPVSSGPAIPAAPAPTSAPLSVTVVSPTPIQPTSKPANAPTASTAATPTTAPTAASTPAPAPTTTQKS